MKKLVKVDPSTGRFIDIDQKRLKLEAGNLLSYIHTNVDKSTDEHDIYRDVVPMCEKAIKGEYLRSISVDDLPLEYQTRERMLDPEFNKLFSRFCVIVTGTPMDQLDLVDLNGEPHTYVEFID